MLFNSIDFALFLPIVFIIYWFITKSINARNVLILIASYIFYGWWDWRFLGLIAFSSFLDYFIGKGIHKSESKNHKKLLVALSLVVNLGFLGFFKYYNFFVESFVDAFSFFGTTISVSRLEIILPVGISFYTFQTLSYSLDIYRNKLEPSNNIIAFLSFVSFFPQLVAGPIERATNLLPQFSQHKSFNYSNAVDGVRQILWGLFKKVVIADNCARYVDSIFNTQPEFYASTLLLGAVLFAFQIYGDFSGYSDIAIGVSRLFDFNLKRNFAFPYFSRDIAEFWRRWHISLSTWFRDYLYIPLGGSRGSKGEQIRNTFIIFLVSGFWHGANWTFIVWGFIHALLFIPLLVLKRNRNNKEIVAINNRLPSVIDLGKIILTFGLVTVAWVFFRADNLAYALDYLQGMASLSMLSLPQDIPVDVLIFVFLMVGIEWVGRRDEHALENLGMGWNANIRRAFYLALSFIIFLWGVKEQSFIYFQF